MPDREHPDEIRQGHQFLPLRSRICFMDRTRDDKMHMVGHHLCGLVGTDAGLKGSEVFFLDPGGFGEDLPPAVFAGTFGSEHMELRGWVRQVVICRDTGEQEIGLRSVLGFSAARMGDVLIFEHLFKVVLERVSDARFPSIVDAEGKRHKCIDIPVKALIETFADDFPFERAEENLLHFHPRHDRPVRIRHTVGKLFFISFFLLTVL